MGSSRLPTAVQKAADRHVTADSLARAAAGLGVAWTDHEVPSRASARAKSRVCSGAGLGASLTAVQVFADRHDTALRQLLAAPAGMAA